MTAASVEKRPYARRRRKLAGSISAQAAIITSPADVRYLCGFDGEDSVLIVGQGWAHLVTDGRFTEQAQNQCPDVEVHTRSGSMAAAIGKILSRRRVRRAIVQDEHVTLARKRLMDAGTKGIRLTGAKDIVAEQRAVKDTGEIRAIRRAVKVARGAFDDLLARGAGKLAGRRERDIAAELEYLMKLAGADGPAFETIVAAGAHASLPHWRPGATKVRGDSVVLVDWGARVGGYCSDLTRVVFTGRIPPKLARIYRVVHKAQEAAVKVIRPGVACKTVDAAARTVIEQSGFGENFTHGVGHGLGLEVHESPRLGLGLDRRLRKGMVVTIEPGIYIPRLGGVRIEDDVEVTARGARRLSKKAPGL